MSSAIGNNGLLRTHHCAELRATHIGQKAVLCGWVNKYRDLGGLHFIDIRDKHGLTQLSFEEFKGDLSILKNCSLESVIKATGVVRARPDSAKNAKMETGEVELLVSELEVLSQSDIDSIPFLPLGPIDASEVLRLKYRYLDLRRPHLQSILKLRSTTAQKAREVLTSEGFIEVETPILYKSTPEGARDYIVPSRVHPSHVYALPQSPQTLKQLLMIGGTDKYFQICRCFRDEDLRADRQPEFTQIDIEVSFPTQDYIRSLVEKMLIKLFDLEQSFKLTMVSYDEVINLYGSDKPDVRYGLKQIMATDLFVKSDFAVFANPANNNGMIKATFIPASMGTLARKDLDGLTDVVKPHGGKGVAFFKVEKGELSGGVSKFITKEIHAELEARSTEGKGDGIWLFNADTDHDVVHACADAVRRHLAKKLNLIKDGYAFLWVYDFPLLEWDKENNRFAARHHPFTSPKRDQYEKFLGGKKEDLMNMPAEAYDIVCNGYEIGGGSLRIYRNDVQDQMFKILGMTPEDTKRQFGFFIDALKYGTPPHGGLAFGFDRIIMLLAKTDSISDVIAFPKTTSATDLMSQAPSIPSEAQLKELHFEWTKK